MPLALARVDMMLLPVFLLSFSSLLSPPISLSVTVAANCCSRLPLQGAWSLVYHSFFLCLTCLFCVLRSSRFFFENSLFLYFFCLLPYCDFSLQLQLVLVQSLFLLLRTKQPGHRRRRIALVRSFVRLLACSLARWFARSLVRSLARARLIIASHPSVALAPLHPLRSIGW